MVESAIHPSLRQRKIIHVDMDAFYASVEIRDDPKLAGLPLVIGGSPNSRGVVCTASYEARKFGIRSAMASSHAARLCPQAIFMAPNFVKYRDASHEIRKIFQKFTSKIEPLSLDEAYLDVTENPQNLYAVQIAKAIQTEIRNNLSLSASAGVAPNKLLAKIASDFRKPAGLTVVLPDHAQAFMGPLPLRKIHGVGPATEKRLAQVGLHRCADVWPLSMEELAEKTGTMAEWLYEASRGIDERPVESNWVRKSIGQEETFAKDIATREQVEAEVEQICQHLAAILEEKNIRGRTVTLKIKYADFHQITRSYSSREAVMQFAEIFPICQELLNKTEVGRRSIRLAGVSLANLQTARGSPVVETAADTP